MEKLHYNFLFRWFVRRSIDEPIPGRMTRLMGFNRYSPNLCWSPRPPPGEVRILPKQRMLVDCTAAVPPWFGGAAHTNYASRRKLR